MAHVAIRTRGRDVVNACVLRFPVALSGKGGVDPGVWKVHRMPTPRQARELADMKKPLRGAIIGHGFIMEKGHAYRERKARARAEGREPDVEMVALAGVCRERRELAARHFPGTRTYADFLELLDGEAGNLDFVDIATPPAQHAAVARAALSRGLHVLCEKPLATTIADARDMLDCALAAKRVLYPCHWGEQPTPAVKLGGPAVAKAGAPQATPPPRPSGRSARPARR